jgi:hypothetical protein
MEDTLMDFMMATTVVWLETVQAEVQVFTEEA